MIEPARPWRDERYAPVQLIGRGSSGVVYRVLDRETGAELALKTFAARDADSLYRLKQEFRACAGIRHRHLVELYELRVDDADCFFTMELIDGVDFVRHVRDGADRRPRLRRFLAAARQLVQGLAALHAAGRLHRDVKPPNALVDHQGRAVLLDFGFMVAFGAGALAGERSDTVAGSLAYMAPEILTGAPPAPAADWYSAGVMFYEALSGALPYDTPAALLGRSLPPALDAALPPRLRDLVMALLAGVPERRPGAEEIARVIDTCSAEERMPVHPPPSPLADELPFVGRVAELALLHAAAGEAGAGAPVVVELTGPSGIGKSELARQFLRQVERDAGAVVLRGRCHPYEAVPYRAFDGLIDSLSRYLVSLPEADAAALAPRHAATLVRLFPVLGRVPALAARPGGGEGLDPLEQRRRGFAALRELLARLAERQRLVLWIDDVQWADADSAALAGDLFAGPDPPPLLLLLTQRSDDGGAAGAFAAGLPATRRRLVLEPLPPAEAQALAERIAVGALADLSTVVREAAGSPFLLGQLVRHAVSTAGGPARGLADVMQARLAQLGAPARRLLEVVAVAGRPLAPDQALAAADLLRAARRELITLQEDRLLRLAPSADNAVEVYHDRIRESVLATLPPAVLRERHRGLAHTLVRDADPDPQALFRHFLGAGETEPAADWAAEAAARADRAFAFAEAADLYRAAAELHGPRHTRHLELQVKQATALANAGRGGEAAPLFLAAAADSGPGEALDLRRQAAEQFMQTGRLDDGVACLRALLPTVGLRYPHTTTGAAATTLLRLMQIAARTFLRPTPHRARHRSDHSRIRLATSRSAAKGLAMVDPFRGLYFAVRTLALALDTGDARLIARGLAEVGATLVPAGPPLATWAARMLERAARLATELDDPYLIGLSSITLAQRRMVEGRWSEMLALCDRGAEVLRDHCRGVSWEVAIAGLAAERALEELGRLDEVEARAAAALLHAEQLDDMVRTCASRQGVGLVSLLRGRTDDARQQAERVRRRWTAQGFHMQHFYCLRLDAYSDVVDGRPADGLRRLQEAWPALRRSNLLRHALIGVDAGLLRARVSLAVAARDPRRWPSLADLVERDVAGIERRGGGHNSAHASMLRANVAVQQGDRATAAHLARAAADAFVRHEMALHVAACGDLLEYCAGDRATKLGLGRTTAPDSDVPSRLLNPSLEATR